MIFFEDKGIIKRFLKKPKRYLWGKFPKVSSITKDYTDIIYNNVNHQIIRAPAGMYEIEGKLNKEISAISKQNKNIGGKQILIGNSRAKK